MSKIRKISGFPEWLPGQKIVEEQIIDRIRAVYQRAGFVPIETSAVELLSTLQAKGSVDKEIYTLRRLHADPDEKEREELALHFDLTVPFSRYVAQHFSDIIFPFKRYQLQKVWRGERPQKGRYREFYQFDIDVICRDDLPVSCDAEALEVFAQALKCIGLPRYEIRLNDRRLLLGFYASLDISPEQSKKIITIVDKLDKIGRSGVATALQSELSLSAAQIESILSFSEGRYSLDDAKKALVAKNVQSSEFSQGCDSINLLGALLSDDTRQKIVLDLSLARGLDYYTGLIVEVRMVDHPEFGSIGSGGRYEDLASEFINQKLPGVGFSIGISRILGFLFEKGGFAANQSSRTQVLVAVYNEEQRKKCVAVANKLRALGVVTEVYYKSPKLGKQLDFADAKSIPYVLFLGDDEKPMQVKNLKTKDQCNVENLEEFAATIGHQ